MAFDLRRSFARFDRLPNCPAGSIPGVGFHLGSPGVSPPPGAMRRWPHHVIVLSIYGTAQYRDELGGSRRLARGDAFLISPGVAHAFWPDTPSGWSEFFINFEGPAFAPWVRAGLLDARSPFYRLEPVDYWLDRFREVWDCEETPSPHQAMLRIARMVQVLAEMSAQRAEEAGDRSDRRWLARARALVESDGRAAPPLAAIAARLGMSYDGFRKRFAQLSGLPPRVARQRHVARRACALLAAGEDSLAAIADRLGFVDVHHFSRRFKAQMGVPPSVFRERLGGAG